MRPSQVDAVVEQPIERLRRKHLRVAEAESTPSHDHGVEQRVRLSVDTRSLPMMQLIQAEARRFLSTDASDDHTVYRTAEGLEAADSTGRRNKLAELLCWSVPL